LSQPGQNPPQRERGQQQTRYKTAQPDLLAWSPGIGKNALARRHTLKYTPKSGREENPGKTIQ
jgi:hypothetical protein